MGKPKDESVNLQGLANALKSSPPINDCLTDKQVVDMLNQGEQKKWEQDQADRERSRNNPKHYYQ